MDLDSTKRLIDDDYKVSLVPQLVVVVTRMSVRVMGPRVMKVVLHVPTIAIDSKQ